MNKFIEVTDVQGSLTLINVSAIIHVSASAKNENQSIIHIKYGDGNGFDSKILVDEPYTTVRQKILL